MVGFPASGPNIVCKPGRVATPPELNTTSWQSGETPCGKSAGAISVTSPLKISMGASNEPAVVIRSFQSSVVSCQYSVQKEKRAVVTGYATERESHQPRGGGFELAVSGCETDATSPNCAAFSLSRIAPHALHTATPGLMRSAHAGHSVAGFGS